jgi:hypothetical protein
LSFPSFASGAPAKTTAQETELVRAAQSMVLPPLQSVLELTTAFQPPTKSLEAQPAAAMVAEAGAVEGSAIAASASAPAPHALGRQLADVTGVLPDGTT